MRIVGTIGSTLAPHGVRVAQWWRERSARERRLLAALGIVLAVAALVALMIRPLQAARASALADIHVYDALAAQLRAGGPVTAAVPRRTGDAAAIVAASLPEFGLAAASSVAQGAGVRVELRQVGYDALVRWLADLDRTSDLRVARLRIVPAAPGLIDATLVLAR